MADEPSRWHWNGFISQGYVYAKDNNFFVDDQDPSWASAAAGFSASYNVNSATRFNGQVIYRHSGDHQEEGVRLDYGFVDRFIQASDQLNTSAKFGRIKSQLGIYGDSLSAPFTRPGIFSPQSSYSELFRNFLVSYDGVELLNSVRLAQGELSIALWGGFPVTNGDEVLNNSLGESAVGDFDDHGYTSALHIKYDTGSWLVGASYVDAPFQFDADADSIVDSGFLSIDDLRLFAQYNFEHWELTAEYMEQVVETEGLANRLLPAGLMPDEQRWEPRAYFLQARHFVSPSVTLLFRYDAFFADHSDSDGEDAAARTQLLAAAVSQPQLAQRPDMFYAKFWTLGASWEPDSNWLLRIEYSDVEGSGRSPAQFAPNSQVNDEKDWSVFSFQAAYRF
ncbi:MAG: hypothetical protein AseanaTS_11230 [Candidatus Pelagadaptatus aseana]